MLYSLVVAQTVVAAIIISLSVVCIPPNVSSTAKTGSQNQAKASVWSIFGIHSFKRCAQQTKRGCPQSKKGSTSQLEINQSKAFSTVQEGDQSQSKRQACLQVKSESGQHQQDRST